MSALQIICIVASLAVSVVGIGLLVRAIRHFTATFKLGQPEPAGRTDAKGARTATLFREFLGHTRMSRLPVVAIAHWFTMISFGVLFFTLINAFGQLFDPHFVLPVIGHFFLYEWITDFFAFAGFFGIIALIAIRQKNHPRGAQGEDGRRSRFFGSTFWQAYYVELTILGVAICIALLRALEWTLARKTGSGMDTALHFPLTGWIGNAFTGMSLGAVETLIIVVATIKILISMAWMITIALTPTMGVAWHRFLAFFNIFFKRHADGRTSLGELQPMTVDGQAFSMEAMEEMDEDTTLGVGKVEDFTWKGLLDFSTCTECGRCQSQCPAWNTDKPLSPKLLMMTLRDHSHAKAPFLAAAQGVSGVISAREARPQTAAGVTRLGSAAATEDADGAVATKEATDVATTEAIDWESMALVGPTGYDIDNPLTAYNPHGPDAVIDEDVLWSCTTCGACVEQCPVDIEHVDHIVDMRRYQNLIESAFPSELGGLFKKLESKGNPWGMGAKARMDWAKDLPFSIKVLGEDVERADEVDYLFWVGCAGAYEDRAKKTTRAIAELFDHADVNFAVLGNGETCTGDSARRAGNEVLFQMLAEQNVETLNEVGATKIVVTCAHCFNTIKNEYPQLGGKYEVLHHTQLLNRLVREKKIVPVNRPSGPRRSSLKDVASTAGSVTYHDPCYLGRHNNVYTPPRELIGSLPGVELREMERSGEKSFCCGAGGARMWMEEQLGSRINMNRTEEAIATGADRIAVGCPFCRVMLSDGLTAKQSEGASEDIEVVDIAQMLLASVKEAQEAPAKGTTEAEEQATAEPKTAVAAPTEGRGAKDATPEAPSAAETAATAAAVDEAGEDGDAVKGQETDAASQNAAPSWETDAASANSAPSWEDPAPAAAAPAEDKGKPAEEPKAEAAPAASPTDAASANAAPSWETDVAAANSAPSWEDSAAAPTDPASANAAPSWEIGAPAAPAEGSATSETEKPAAPAADDVAAQNAAPSWETGGAAPAATAETKPESPAATESTEDNVGGQDQVTGDEAVDQPKDEVTAEEPAAQQETSAPAAATGDDSLAAQNAAPSWETDGTAPAATAETKPESTEDNVGGQDQVTGDEAVDQPKDEVTAEEPAAQQETSAPAAATGDDSLAAQNAAPSWETEGTAPAATAETKPESPAATESTEDNVGGQDQVTGDEAVDQPKDEVTAEEPAAQQETSAPAAATGDDSLAAQNAAPSWETDGTAPAATAETKPESTEDNVGGQDQVTGDEAVDQPKDEVTGDETVDQPKDEVTAEEPATDAETPAEPEPDAPAPAVHPAPEGVDLEDLKQQNANPSWE